MSVIDTYLDTLDTPQRAELQRVRSIVRKRAPDAEEVISYGIPAFKYKGKYLIGFNQFKDHLSIFPTSEPIEVMRDELKASRLSKGTIQFTVENPVPTETIEKLVAIRMKSISKPGVRSG